MNTNKINQPASCSVLTEDEMTYVSGGNALETAAKAVIAIGGAVGLTVVAGAAAVCILNIFNPKAWADVISGSVEGGQNFIDGSVSAGQSFLDGLMGK